MARITIEDCLKVIDNAFDICSLAGRRAKDLAAGAEPLIDCDDKPTVIALREIGGGNVSIKDLSSNAILRLRKEPDEAEQLVLSNYKPYLVIYNSFFEKTSSHIFNNQWRIHITKV